MKDEEYEEEKDKNEEENNNKKNKGNNNISKEKLDENDIVNYNVNNSNNSYLNIDKNNNDSKDKLNNTDLKIIELKKEKKKFSLMFKNKLKDYETLSKKFDKLLNKVEIKQKKQKDNNNNTSRDKKLLEKELQLKTSLAMIKNLTKENKKLKEELDTIKIKYFSNEEWQIITKNSEIEKLKKKNIELNKKYEDANFNKINYENILNQKDEIINRQKKKIFELKYKSENDKSSSINNISVKENKNKTILNFKTTARNKLLKSSSQLDVKQLNNKFISLRKYINENHYNFLNDKEKSALKNLFDSNEDYNSFRAKYNIVENRNKRAENQLEKKIVNLETQLKEKENLIEELNKKLKEKESTIKILENKIKEMNNRIKIAENKNKRIILSVEDQLKENGYNIDNLSVKDKMNKLYDLINHLKKELDKNYIQKQKEEEISKINQEIGNIQFFDDNFFKNYKTTNK